jgi:hypothetical protein
MLELRLRSGQVVAFDGRVLEVFSGGEPSARFHVEQLGGVEADGSREVVLHPGTAPLVFAPGEEPACSRLLAAIADARPGG